MNAMKKFMLFGISLLISLLLVTPTFAAVIDPGTGAMDNLGSTESMEEASTEENSIEDSNSGFLDLDTHILTGSEMLPDATIDDVDDYIQDKGGQIIHVVQMVACFIDAIVFIVCFILMLIGAFGNKQLLSRGGIGCLICLIVFVAIYYAPALLEWFRLWAAPSLY